MHVLIHKLLHVVLGDGLLLNDEFVSAWVRVDKSILGILSVRYSDESCRWHKELHTVLLADVAHWEDRVVTRMYCLRYSFRVHLRINIFIYVNIISG